VATFGVFGTTAVLLLTDQAAVGQAVQMAKAELAAVDLACSRFRPDSELSRLNASAGALAHISGLFAELIAEALRAAELTDGDVDPTCGAALIAAGYDRDFSQVAGSEPAVASPSAAVPGWRSVRLDVQARTARLDNGATLDLGSTAKAWAADRCAGLISETLRTGVLLSLGGDIATGGLPPADGWHVKATDDHAAAADAPGQTVTITAGGLATSSTTVRAWDAEGGRMHHIIDPRTGRPAVSTWRTVTVAAATCADANIASTASIIRSEAAPAWLTELGLPARLVAHDGTVTTTAGWPVSST
jgi:FAD:protein FMN transferase